MDSSFLLEKTKGFLRAATERMDLGEIARLTRLATRVAEIEQTQKRLAQELVQISTELDRDSKESFSAGTPRTQATNSGPPTTPSDWSPRLRGPLTLEINWSAGGKPYPNQTICEPKASETMRVFFEAILSRFGENELEKLSALRVSRAPLLSRRPEIEFLNRRQGTLYAHQRVGSSDWHVLTHSATREKIEITRAVAQALGFPPGAISTRTIDVQQEFRRPYAR